MQVPDRVVQLRLTHRFMSARRERSWRRSSPRGRLAFERGSVAPAACLEQRRVNSQEPVAGSSNRSPLSPESPFGIARETKRATLVRGNGVNKQVMLYIPYRVDGLQFSAFYGRAQERP